MIPDDPELRRGLEARSGAPTSEFTARLRSTVANGRPQRNLMPAVAAGAVIAISMATIGILVAGGHANRIGHGPPASGTRVASPSPVPTGEFPECVLPYSVGNDGRHFQGGFISGAQGQFTPDPQAWVDESGSLLVTRATPTLTGAGDSSVDGVSYDAAVKRWLPVPLAHVRPDGLAYAYDETYETKPANPSMPFSTRIHVVSLPDGTDRIISTGETRAVMAYEPDGIYVVGTSYGSDAPWHGLWRLNPTTGAATKLPVDSGYWPALSRDALWDVNSSMAFSSRLSRVDISTGVTQTWVDSSGWGYLEFLGLDSNSDPLVGVGVDRTAASARAPSGLSIDGLYVFTAPNKGTWIGSFPFRGEAVSDSHGTWIASDGGLYLLAPGRPLALVSGVTGGKVAGPCI